MSKLASAILIFVFSSQAFANCDIDYSVNLKTLGQSVIVELRNGVPGKSQVVSTKRSSGGAVNFDALCAGKYFLAIGDDESVDVTPVRTFEEGHGYSSEIVTQRRHGNVSKKKRSSL